MSRSEMSDFVDFLWEVILILRSGGGRLKGGSENSDKEKERMFIPK